MCLYSDPTAPQYMICHWFPTQTASALETQVTHVLMGTGSRALGSKAPAVSAGAMHVPWMVAVVFF